MGSVASAIRLLAKRAMIVSQRTRRIAAARPDALDTKARPRDDTFHEDKVEGLFRQQRQPLNIPRKVMHGARGRENHGSSRSERQSHQPLPRNFDPSFPVG